MRRDFYGDLMASDHVVLRIDPDPQLPILVEDGYPHLFAPLPVQAAQVFPGFP